jgi:hypothetical protein
MFLLQRMGHLNTQIYDALPGIIIKQLSMHLHSSAEQAAFVTAQSMQHRGDLGSCDAHDAAVAVKGQQ